MHISRRTLIKGAAAGATLIGATGPFVLRHGLAADPLVIGV